MCQDSAQLHPCGSRAACATTRRVKWALKRIELFAPTGAPHTEAGREALSVDAKKPALKKDTPLCLRVRRAAALVSGLRQISAGDLACWEMSRLPS